MRQRCRSPWFLLFFALLAAAALSLSPAAARACIWDTDTLAQEARAFPDLVSVITGRFPRNPPLFYEMRLRRAADQIAVNPDDLAAYDDAGAACDRLRRGDEAIAWMEKKRARLARLNPADPNVREHWYRYHANVGTFWAHRWLRTGAARERLGEMRTARDHIARAIALNPNAHFGRETYQLQIMDWLIDSRAAAPARSPAATKTGNADRYRDTSLSHYLRDRRKTVAVPPNGANASDAAIKGLAGLIVLGDAWESVDVFAALAGLLGGQHASLAHLAKLRCREIIYQGRRSLDPQAPQTSDTLAAYLRVQPEQSYGLDGKQREHNARRYPVLRREADARQKRRTDYLLARLQTGRHPDTDPAFWNGWRDTPPPSLEGPWLWERMASLRNRNTAVALLVMALIGLMGLIVAGAVAQWLLRRFVLRHGAAR